LKAFNDGFSPQQVEAIKNALSSGTSDKLIEFEFKKMLLNLLLLKKKRQIKIV